MTVFYSQDDATNAASKFGQMIGETLERSVIDYISGYLNESYPDYCVLQPQEGLHRLTLEMLGGVSRQMDTVIATRLSDNPVALLETKWLKDGRHHNDKGAWILQLREVKKKYSTIRGAAAILAGYWTDGVGLMLMSEGGIKMVIIASDKQVYESLQAYIDSYTDRHNLGSLKLVVAQCRNRYPRAWVLANTLIDMGEDRLKEVSDTWLGFVRRVGDQGKEICGRDLINKAIDDLLSPLPPNPRISKFELSIQIDTGNTIYLECADYEEALEFLQLYQQDPRNIIEKITPINNRPL